MTFNSAKTLAGIGSLLLCVPFVNIIGVLLLLMGMNTLSKHYKDSRICDTGLIIVFSGNNFTHPIVSYNSRFHQPNDLAAIPNHTSGHNLLTNTTLGVSASHKSNAP